VACLEEENWLGYNIITYSVLLGCLGWFFKSIIDSLINYDKPFLEVLILDVPASEVFIRIFVCICFFIFGVFLSKNSILRKNAEEALKNAHEKLTDANQKLEKKIYERTEKIEKLLKEKDELIIQLSHDLKTPLTPLMALLPSVYEDVEDPELKELLEISIKNIHYIRDMVSKIVDIARIDSELTVFNIEDTNLQLELEKVLSDNEYIFKNNEILIENNVDYNINIQADKLRLREVLNNLVNNAVKYTPPQIGGVISFDAEEDDDFILISVHDTGLGLKKEHIEHVFDEMYKVDLSRHDLSSNGLGLPICKRIVEKLGGKIWVASPGEGKGTTVFFTIPSLALD